MANFYVLAHRTGKQIQVGMTEGDVMSALQAFCDDAGERPEDWTIAMQRPVSADLSESLGEDGVSIHFDRPRDISVTAVETDAPQSRVRENRAAETRAEPAAAPVPGDASRGRHRKSDQPRVSRKPRPRTPPRATPKAVPETVSVASDARGQAPTGTGVARRRASRTWASPSSMDDSRGKRDRERHESALGHQIESHRFWDLVVLLARERLEHEDLVARALATAVIRDGLQLHSVDPRWLSNADGSLELRGTPYVGYTPAHSGELMVVRPEALDHLRRVVQAGRAPNRDMLREEFIRRGDFARWLIWAGEPWPRFWFPSGPERLAV